MKHESKFSIDVVQNEKWYIENDKTIVENVEK